MTNPARFAALAGGLAWGGALTGWGLGPEGVAITSVVTVPVLLAVLGRRIPPAAVVLVTVAIAAAASGSLAGSRRAATHDAVVPDGRVQISGVVADEPVLIRDELWVVLGSVWRLDEPAALPPIGVVWADGAVPGPGDRVFVDGRLTDRSASVRGDPIAGRLTATRSTIVAAAPGPLHRAAVAVRSRVTTVLAADGGDTPNALLAGFLIGDTSNLPTATVDDLRAAGLSHFVAVSGSNVALFLAAWWLILTPFAGPRVRAGVGLVGVALFAVVTRWEPSVLRAATMIGLVLVGRIAGIPIDAVVALGWGVALLLLVAGDLAANVGFQLSVAATIGVMIGARWAASRRPRVIWSILGATAGAQVAVAPIALFHFGTIPLMAPVANLIAAPMVTAATGLGGLAVLLGGGPVLAVSRVPAGAVLAIADVMAGWPQLDGAAFVAVVATASLLRVRSLRVAAAGALLASVAITAVPGSAPPGATLTALSVGQGDAILVRDDAVMLVDGGRDPAVLLEALDRHRVDRIDVLVATHGDADHAGGLIGITGTRAVGEVWVPAFGERGEFVDDLVDEVGRLAIPVIPIAAGMNRRIGRLHVSVLGPQRRYETDNDGAVVLWIDGGATAVLLPSDVEAVAQRELPALQPDVMLVPHHGAATTDLEWLAATAGPLAVISVGQNPYGHPRPEVLAVLEELGSRVISTADGGDVVVSMLAP